MSALARIFLISALLLGHYILIAQDILEQKIHLTDGTKTIYSVFQELQEQNIPIAYSQSKIPNSSLKISEGNMSLGQFLDYLRKQSNITYEVNNNIILLSYSVAKKKPGTIRGVVRDIENGEVLIGATVYQLKSEHGVITNNYGYYSLALSRGKHIIEAGYVGYKSFQDTIVIDKDVLPYDIYLVPEIDELSEVIVSARAPNFNITSLIPGFNTIDLNTEGQIPYFMGEVDVLQGAALLPGIRTLGEDANGLNVRGGNVDQNLILLDEATVYNPNHLYGLVSVFNPEAVNHIEIMKGFIPPSYGGRASSVITVHQKEGDYKNYHITGGASFLSAKFIAEGPIKKEESSFILSGRHSLFGLQIDENSDIRFQDLNAKVNWKVNKKNIIYFSGYLGNDRNSNIFETVRNWGNRNYSFRWNHLLGNKFFTNTSAIISEYNYKITQPREAASYIGTSKIIDYTVKSDWGYVINPNNEINFGVSSILHKLRPGERVPFDEQTSSANTLILDAEHGLESALYLSHQTKIGPLSMLYGLRLSSLHYLGAAEVFQYEQDQPKTDESIIDTISYGGGKNIKNYIGWEPRFSTTYQFSKRSSLKLSYTKSYQYLHLISSTITPAPTDIWKLSGPHVSPTSSDHYSLGLYTNLKENQLELYVEGYYKNLHNLLDYKNGADLLFNKNPETELLSGDGRAYGVEFFLKKNQGRFTGWISYNLSRSEIKVNGAFPEERVNNGNYFPANHDKKHDFSIVGIYKLFPRLSSSFSFSYNSGRPFTLPVAKYEFEGNLIPQFDQRNQYRLPDYHRLDISLKLTGKKINNDGSLRRYQDYWTIVAYNVYGRNNVYSYLFQKDEETGTTDIVPYAIFDSIIPGITYNFRF